MSMRELLNPILTDEAVTRGLGDKEAQLLVEWLAEWAELLADVMPDEEAAREPISQLCRRARTITRFVQLWSEPHSRGAALQLAASERCRWPMPPGTVDPADLMTLILTVEQPSPIRRAA